MQRSFQCCDEMGDLVQSGASKWSSQDQGWQLKLAAPPSQNIQLVFCPFCGVPIEDSDHDCLDLQECVEEKTIVWDLSLSNFVLAFVSDAEPMEFEYCPFCGEEQDSGDPTKRQAD